MLKSIPIAELQPGHYVTRVIEQAGDVKIKSKGKISKTKAIQELANKGIQLVEIDLSKSDVFDASAQQQQTEKEDAQAGINTQSEFDSASLEKANDLYMQAILAQSEFIDELQKGAAHDLSPVKAMSEQLIENLFDNANALSCLTHIKNTDQYLLEHSLNCCILMAMFAEHLGYDTHVIEALSLGALLMDIGMINIPAELRTQTAELAESDWHVIRSHVEDGLDMIEQAEDLDPIARTVIAEHHERIDGSGYPKGLHEQDISIFGRMAAIVDVYDALVSQRPHRDAVPPAVALKRLAKTPGLDTELVRKFITRFGIHPVGSLVKLKSGKLGIVAKPNPLDMLNPVVMTFYTISGSHYNDVKRVDLSKVEDEIDSSVHPKDFNLNLPKFFRDVFIHQV